jgi:ribonuclease HI
MRWKKKNWFRAPGERAKNVDLWQRFLDVFEVHDVQFRWVKGHAGNVENERCDTLAVAAAQEYGLPPDTGYLEELRIRDSRLGAQPAEKGQGSGPVGDEEPAANIAHPSIPEGESVPTEGSPCRKCGTRLIKKETKKTTRKPGQAYCYDWYLFCPGCNTMYMVDAAKRMLS